MNKIIICLIGAAVFLSSCATYNVFTDKARDVDFKKYKNYAWLPDADTGHGKILIDNDILRQNLHNAVNAELQNHGLHLDTLHPDALVIVHTQFEKKQETINTPLYSSYPYYYSGIYYGPWYPYYWGGFSSVPYVYGNEMQTVNFTEGSIVIDMIDRQTQKLLWRGWTEERIYTPKDFEKTIGKKVNAIFQKFPLRSKDDN